MGRKKKVKSNRSDGRYNLSFRFEGKVYAVTGRDYEDAILKKEKRLKELQAGAVKRINPSMQEYFDIFIRREEGNESRRKVKGATVLRHKTSWKRLAAVKVNGNTTFAEMKLRKVNQADMDIVQDVIAKELKSSTVNRYMSFAKQLFKDAIDRGIRETVNPCNTIASLARIEPRAQETCHRALSVEESKRFFEAAEDSHYREFTIVLSETGVRLGEASALTLSDLDFEKNEIYISRTITRNKDSKTEIGDSPKTEAGNRMVPMTERCKAALLERLKKNEIIYANNSDRVFRTVRGCVVQADQVDRELQKICKKANIEPISAHGLRALFATRFREQFPENPYVLKSILGHSKKDITEIYAAVTKATLHRYMKGFNLFYDPDCKAKCKAKFKIAV